ncbi:SDR family NAD(P)-dependent oxidoreductase, partial [Pelagibacteraceae bacterium]|nr:SDR family NAD(P)-dependent oxidoreductase [Pelagibacteraceae bacterium]
METILVTGAAGFIGSHLVEHLVKKGKKVIAFDRYNNLNNWGNLENSKFRNDFEMVLGDIRDYDSVYNSIKRCDSVFHLAALIGIPYSYLSPLAYIKTNIEGTYNVLEASKTHSLKNIIITSTSETYGSAVKIPMNENHRLIAQSPYSASKIAADNLSLSYYLSFNLPIKIIRPFNCYGPRQSSRAIIPTIVSQLYNNRANIKLGNLDAIRDLTYVDDLVDAFYKVFNSKKFIGEVTNV